MCAAGIARGWNTASSPVNDQAAGLGGKVVAGTPRDSLYVLDVLYDRDGGKRPETIVTDTASYSDIIFGLLTLAGFAYAPQLADLPDQKMWRIDRTADYGAFQEAARGRVDLARIERWWEDILRIIGSIHTGAVRAYDVIRMLSRDGRPTPLGHRTDRTVLMSAKLLLENMWDTSGNFQQDVLDSAWAAVPEQFRTVDLASDGLEPTDLSAFTLGKHQHS